VDVIIYSAEVQRLLGERLAEGPFLKNSSPQSPHLQLTSYNAAASSLLLSQ